MSEQYSNNIQDMFFSKDMIAGLNKSLIQQANLQNLNRESKQEVINILVKNMKTIYRAIDSSKINRTNIGSILDQYKSHSLTEAINEISKSKLNNKIELTPSDLKFKRDFASNPTNGNKFLDRPESTKKTGTPIVPIVQQMRNKSIPTQQNELDQMFKPIVNENAPNKPFNNYNAGRTKDINEKMDEISKMRQQELNSKNQRPSTPDFLKSTSMGSKNDKESIQSQGQQNQNIEENFNGLANDTGENLYSLDNIDKPLVTMELVEDTSSFEDRLKRLQSDRDGYKPIINNQGTIDFTSDNFPKNTGINTNTIQTSHQERMQREQQQQEKQHQQQQILLQQQREQQQRDQQQQQQREQQQLEHQQREQQQQREMLQQQQEQHHQRELLQQQRDQQQQREMLQKQRDQQQQRDIQQYREVQLIQPQDDNKIMQLSNRIIELQDNKMRQQEQIISLQAENEKLSMNSDIVKINSLKEHIASEFDKLRASTDEYENNMVKLASKEKEIVKKETEIKQLMSIYENLSKIQQLQVEVTNKDNKSSYTFNMLPINNTISIKLMSYTLPVPRFNIEINNNNTFKFKLNNIEQTIEVPTGKYNIDDLIHKLDEQLTQHNIKISVNIEQKVVVESLDESNTIELIETDMLKYNLGFTKKCKDNSSYISDNTWDLRVDDRVYLYLSNLEEEVPFGLLYFTGHSISQFKFQEPFNLNKLEIKFKNSKGIDYNFYNLPHSLSFLIEKYN
jgi:hypothetical protein